MKFKSLVLLLTLLVSFTSTASIGKEELIDAIKGRYTLQTSEFGDIVFLIRSTGKLQVIKTDWFNINDSADSYPAKISFQQGDNGLLRGVPTAHLIFSEGSDEQAIDYHLILTAEQSWDRRSPTVRFLSSFVLENDGPNQTSSVISTEKLTLLKYDSHSKTFTSVK